MERTIKHTFQYPHPVALVWDYLTMPDLIAEWLMENDFRPVVGHKFQFKARPKAKLRFDGDIYCEVLEVVPHRRLSYSWKGGDATDKARLDTVVTWTLVPKDNGTMLTLEHKGFEGLKNYVAYFIMNFGWVKIEKRLLKKISDIAHGSPKA